MSEPILTLPKNEGCFILDTDTLDFGCRTVSKADQSTCRSTRFEARPKASCIAIRKQSYRLCFRDFIERQKQVRNNVEGIAGRGFRP